MKSLRGSDFLIMVFELLIIDSDGLLAAEAGGTPPTLACQAGVGRIVSPSHTYPIISYKVLLPHTPSHTGSGNSPYSPPRMVRGGGAYIPKRGKGVGLPSHKWFCYTRKSEGYMGYTCTMKTMDVPDRVKQIVDKAERTSSIDLVKDYIKNLVSLPERDRQDLISMRDLMASVSPSEYKDYVEQRGMMRPYFPSPYSDEGYADLQRERAEEARKLSEAEAEERRALKQRYAESGFHNEAVSRAGAIGPYQIMPITYQDYLTNGKGKAGNLNDPEYSRQVRDWVMSVIPSRLGEFWSEDDSDQAKRAKLYGAYVWGSGNMRNFLRRQRANGADISGGVDWVEKLNPEARRYVKYIALDQDIEGTPYTDAAFENAARRYGLLGRGGPIRIKPENRGKFTALKKRTGHSASWFKAHGTPAQKKMAVFALNSKHWSHKHADGGQINEFGAGGPGSINGYPAVPSLMMKLLDPQERRIIGLDIELRKMAEERERKKNEYRERKKEIRDEFDAAREEARGLNDYKRDRFNAIIDNNSAPVYILRSTIDGTLLQDFNGNDLADAQETDRAVFGYPPINYEERDLGDKIMYRSYFDPDAWNVAPTWRTIYHRKGEKPDTVMYEEDRDLWKKIDEAAISVLPEISIIYKNKKVQPNPNVRNNSIAFPFSDGGYLLGHIYDLSEEQVNELIRQGYEVERV